MNIGELSKNEKEKFYPNNKRAELIYKKIHNEAKPVFVLSTGRTGTKLLSKLMSRMNAVKSYHEPPPELIYYARFAYENKENKKLLKRVVDGARLEYILNAYLNNKIYFESNNRLTFFAKQLEELYPKAKFIHLIRHPGDYTRSGLRRNWYDGHLWDMGRIVPSTESDIPWNEMSQISKISWLWNETNKFIENFKEQVKNSKIITLFSEDIFNDIERIKDIFKFIEVDNPFKDKEIKKFLEKPVNKQKKNEYPKYNKWRDDEKSQLKEYVNLAQKYSYKL